MKKILLSFALISFAISAFSQTALKPVKVDSLVTVSLPAGFQKKDTLGQHIYSANGLYGFMTVINAPNEKNNTPLKKENDLNNVLKKYIGSIQAQSGNNASAQHVRDTTIGTLEAKVFTLKNDDGNGTVQLVNFTLLYTQDATYTFEYVYPEERKDVVKDEYKAFSSSIKLSPQLQRNDQYISNAKGMSPIVQIGVYGGGAVVLLLIIITVVRRRKKLAIS
ncbi:hypothetical protein KXD93_11495 [Mucilaginibacter sp. BJC16-A38]|uniref:hypothetical protein n=1 Tax=Mucilaginibacter phenanthrenivorans TaxID=1234842 RepID=UPI0021588DFD|nr:hypothetical protein [Mucilaginibacter phenanthrenivorans]MCR8558274.1 hypothetical protein [Mucilaginibacter phenanthrenivorans]